MYLVASTEYRVQRLNSTERLGTWYSQRGHLFLRVFCVFLRDLCDLSLCPLRFRVFSTHAPSLRQTLVKPLKSSFSPQLSHASRNIISAQLSLLPSPNCYSKIRARDGNDSACPGLNHADACRTPTRGESYRTSERPDSSRFERELAAVEVITSCHLRV